MARRSARLVLLALVLAAFALALSKAASWQYGYGFRLPAPPQLAPMPTPVVERQERVVQRGRHSARRVVAQAAPLGGMESRFVSSRHGVQTHAASLIELNDGRLRAFWFSGSREGAADVTIQSAVFDPVRGQWSDEQTVTGRAQTQRGLHRYIAKVGNPVPVRAPDGALWLFYVTVSLGGWAGSSITLITSHDEGASWSAPRRLVTSPFLNISTLVKSPPFFYADGTLGLPVYHEFIAKFAEILRLDKTGKVVGKQRLAAGGQGTLQPVVLLQSAEVATVLTRYAGSGAPRVRRMDTQDGGRHWSAPQPTGMHNPNAALSALVLADGSWLAAFNDQQAGRDSLSLQWSRDHGATWRELKRLEDTRALSGKLADEAACRAVVAGMAQETDATRDVAPVVESVRRWQGGVCQFEFSYPWLMQAKNGDLHLVYTWNRSYIKHLRFDALWWQQRVRGAGR
ncbi:MAG: exo-alpha-sialidase [Sideroxydans sp.]